MTEPSGTTGSCPSCGAPAAGNFCARCGAPVRGDAPGRACPGCGREVAADVLYCAECGTPVRGRPRKAVLAYAPWVLSGLALVAFSVAIVLFVQDRSAPRTGDAPITGGVPEAGAAVGGGAAAGPAAAGSPAAGTGGSMPSAEELAAMAPAEAAVRLFDRTMRLREAGDSARARFFAEMGLRAYERVPAGERDADTRLHRGLLHLTLDRPAAARSEAEAILAAEPGHPYGLYLALRAAERRGDGEAARSYRSRLREAMEGGAVPEERYRPHEALLRGAASGGPGGGP